MVFMFIYSMQKSAVTRVNQQYRATSNTVTKSIRRHYKACVKIIFSYVVQHEMAFYSEKINFEILTDLHLLSPPTLNMKKWFLEGRLSVRLCKYERIYMGLAGTWTDLSILFIISLFVYFGVRYILWRIWPFATQRQGKHGLKTRKQPTLI
jgi:hypothetical protein